MCHPTDARPPAPPVTTGGIAAEGPLRLTAADGNAFRAYRAVPEVPNGRSVVILPDIRGLHPFYEALAGRFAEAGFTAIAFDYYGRLDAETLADDDLMRRIGLLEPAHVDADVDAVRELLDGPVFTVGFCLGGGHSWRQAAREIGLAGAVGFYGPPRFFGDSTESLSAPLLMLLAGDDVATPTAEFEALAAGFDRAGKQYEMHVYDGAPHSFFDVAAAEWQEACADAWGRILDFTGVSGTSRR